MAKIVLQNWQFSQADEENWRQATVPGCVHTDLLAHNLIPDPFYAKNELDVQWVDKKDWEYTATFQLSKQDMEEDVLEIVFEGLDTYADVYINNEKVLTADNMFRRWNLDIQPYVHEGENALLIYFHSPILHDIDKPDQLGYNLPADNDHSEDGGTGEKKLSVFARKAPYHYGWDWGPRFVTSGVWKEVYIEAWSDVKIKDVYIKQNKVAADLAELQAIVEVESQAEKDIDLVVSDQHGFRRVEQFSIAKGIQTLEVPFSIAEPNLWWSNGLGDPYLYQFSIDIAEQDTVLSSKKVKTGLRSIRLVQEDDQYGKSFYFELNGVPVFMKGANHIPNDSFLTRLDKKNYQHEIATAAASNMNMLRVWGGGIYEYDEFYQLCDEHGILVWQDFMFACSMYPGDEPFLHSVRQEAIDNVKRLRNYASIALWCGNNEMDAAWSQYQEEAGWGWKQRYNMTQREEIWQAYDKIFHQILPDVLKEYDPLKDYWPSSPMQALSSDEEQHAGSNTVKKGDIHYWDVWHGQKPLEAYKEHVGRFMSEYGFQSFPEEKTVRTYAEEKDFELESPVMLHHQKNGAGNRLIKTYMDLYYKEPKDFAAFLHLSHILQANAIRMAVEAHRMNMPQCMGTLYWQMNDCWPVASWSSMDYYGRWKAVQYDMKDRFKQTVVIADQGNDQLTLYAVSDQLENQAAELIFQVFDFEGNLLDETRQNVEVQGNSSVVIYQEDVSAIAEGRSDVVLLASLKTGDRVLDRVEHLLVKPKDVELENPRISVEYVEDAIELTCQHFAMNVWLETEEDGYFDQNNFSLLPGQKKRVLFTESVIDNVDFSQIKLPEGLVVKSMYDFV
ncbi:glycoside hydrolase family 2 protein [Gracilibacillus oryzae]|uniref:Beta-mannosidase B n=1 Tax=Gracilibacillus oryzae TaxID=1672701 RepID=A0A7C8GTW9_9BACI|nr:glycoside hydrolase family 2 protein [Gracilibacillus oryzae]KAB8134174.1 glycoside hydrolase family 2 protein [Gracilibacillus oryzae]